MLAKAPAVASRTVDNYPYEAKRSIQAVISSTRALIQRDPEQEIHGIALAVADAAIDAVKAAKPDDPIVQSTASIYSADQIGSGDGVREVEVATWSAARTHDWWVKERREWVGRVRGKNGRQRWVKASDVRPLQEGK